MLKKKTLFLLPSSVYFLLDVEFYFQINGFVLKFPTNFLNLQIFAQKDKQKIGKYEYSALTVVAVNWVMVPTLHHVGNFHATDFTKMIRNGISKRQSSFSLFCDLSVLGSK